MTTTRILRRGVRFALASLGAAGAVALGPAAMAHAAPASGSGLVPGVPDNVAAPAETMLATYDGALQPNAYYCGPAATRIALSAHGSAPSFTALAGELGTTVAGTQSIDDVTRVLDKRRGDGTYSSTMIDGRSASAAQTEKLRTDVMDSINHGDPVVANIIGTVRDAAGDSHRYAGGHYVTITGYTDGGDTVRVTDPADRVGSNEYRVSIDAMADWIASRGYTS